YNSIQETNVMTTSQPTDSAPETKRPKADRYIIGFYVMLCIISVVELYSASSREVTSANIFGPLVRQIMMLVMGIVICIGVSRLKLTAIIRLTPAFVIMSVLMMVYVIFAGDVINGARRSFSLPGFSVQPAELLKISSVLIVAYIMSRNQEAGGVKTNGVVKCALIVACFGGMLISQGLTNTLLLMIISCSMMLIGGIQWKKFGLVLVFYMLIGGAGLYYKIEKGSKSANENTEILETGKDSSGQAATINRTNTWLSRMERYGNDSIPKWEQKIVAENRQEMYSYMAQANGGVFGVMPGNSRETARLPLAFSDYIFAIVVEDLGLIGGLFLLVIYLSLLGRAGTIAARCDRAFPAMLVMGMAVMIVFQALFHMAITTGVFPVSGQPLPMISQGGTSMLVTSLAFGIMLSISRYASMAGRKKAQKAPQDLPEALAAVNPTQLKA
ncbi:MAG: FtsW/RodA/SpoVE family cell cycle protein, partial [Muribaculaceae bacterium]|nr:FtsW/RodA/SpoVE family cell cycle protein [Muribaculaceae bacterium]